MVAPADAQSSIDGLLRDAADDLRRFLSELHELSADDEAWRALVAARWQSLHEQLRHVRQEIQGLREQLASQHQHACAAIDAICHTLQQDHESLTRDGDRNRLSTFRDTLAQGLDALLAEIQARRIDLGAEAPREDRTPKLVRSLFHAAMGIACAALYQLVVSREVALRLLAGFVIFFGGVEIARRFSARVNDFWVDRVFGRVARPRERYRTNSATYYMLGLTLITWVADRTICCSAILVLAVGDPIASAVGFRWGRRRFANGKSLVGSLAFLLAAAATLALYLAVFSGVPPAKWALVAAAMAIAGTLTELVSGRIDDNFAIPVVTAAVGMLLW